MSLIVALGALFFYHLYVTDKLTAIKREIEVLKQHSLNSVATPPAKEYTAVSQNNIINPALDQPVSSFTPSTARQTTVPSIPYNNVYQPSEPSAFALWLKQDILVKVGALLLLIALGWFVSYAFANNWIGPVGRISLGILAGLGIIVLGVFRITKQPHQGAIFTVLGSTIIILTIFAARGIYDFFTPATALGLMFITVAFVALVSVRYKRSQQAMASLILGALAPLLTNAPTPEVTGLFLYLLMLVGGTLWVVYLNRNEVLTPLALGIVALYGLPYLDAPLSGETLIALGFTFLFVAIFFVTNVLSMLSTRTESRDAETAQYLTAIGTGLYVFVWIAVAAPTAWQTPLYLMWMLVFSGGAFAVYARTSNRSPFYIYGSVALSLLAAATAHEFSGAILTIVYTIQLLSIVLIADYVVMNSSVARKLAWLFLPLSFLALQHLVSPAWQYGILHTDFFAALLFTIAVMIVGMRLQSGSEGDINKQTISNTLLIVGGSYILILIWLIFHAVVVGSAATTLSLVTYTILGLIFYISGRHENNKNVTTVGVILIAGVVVRLLLIDVWMLQLEQRIILFFIIGVLLLSTAFIKKGNQVS